IQGTELCAVVEQMYSYELLYACTGDKKWAERLEVLAFNALPASISDDMWTHQYVQMSNQIACQTFPGKSLFRTNGSEAHLFGLEPNFGCCTANFNQGWPKFALSTFLYADDRVLSAVPVPSEFCADGIHITLDTAYPFENSFVYTVETKKDFTLVFRVPSFAEHYSIDGEIVSGENAEIAFAVGETRTVKVEFAVSPRFADRPHDLATVECGSLVFSVPIDAKWQMHEYERDGVERKFPYCDYELIPTSDWNYAYASDKFTVVRHGVGDVPFSSKAPAVTVETEVTPIDWGYADGYDTVCAKIPDSREPVGTVRPIKLIPYGSAKLRMTELPRI
ncbi:MAG: glycoside hydrolase family 127 protein, partial [Clostridia bacterium]|nr:glycoside hydrolase family 127 protein [Clostridia bacterium]